MLQAFTEWLATTPLSISIAVTTWAVPAVQTVHIAAIAVVMSSMLMVDLRLLGIVGRTQAPAEVGERFLPWIWRAVVVLLLSGIVLIIAEPGRELLSNVFWLKMSLLVCALLLTAVLQKWLRSGPDFEARRRVMAGVLAVVSILLWTAILSAGRWIAYAEHG